MWVDVRTWATSPAPMMPTRSFWGDDIVADFYASIDVVVYSVDEFWSCSKCESGLLRHGGAVRGRLIASGTKTPIHRWNLEVVRRQRMKNPRRPCLSLRLSLRRRSKFGCNLPIVG